MLYKLIVNAAFLAVGYYIGKQVGCSDSTNDGEAELGESASKDSVEGAIKGSEE